MKRNIILTICTLFICLFSIGGVLFAGVFPVNTSSASAKTCALVPSYAASDFCSSFRSVTCCQCHSQFSNSAYWPVFCPSVTKIYNEMIATYGSIKAGCKMALAKGWSTSLTECEHQWNCDRSGGVFDGKKCNATGNACPATPDDKCKSTDIA